MAIVKSFCGQTNRQMEKWTGQTPYGPDLSMRVHKIVGKGENTRYQHFLLFQQCFQKAFSLRTSKVITVG